MARSELENKIWALFEQKMTDNEILNQVVTEEGGDLTYMDLRILRAEYEEAHPETVVEEEAPAAADDELGGEEEASGIAIDAIRKPGALLSGTARLPSGVTVSWSLDQYGRINLLPDGDAKPTPEDMQFFQEQLKTEFERRGGIM